MAEGTRDDPRDLTIGLPAAELTHDLADNS
jgi:hypothetical protein